MAKRRSTSPAADRFAAPIIRTASGRGTSRSRVLDARPDTLDFRDRMFEPTLIEVQTERPLEQYRAAGVPILDQGTEGACTGFGLATVVNYLLRTRNVVADDQEVSPRMLYDMARRYDEWPGERYSGSSARGAMKGWHKHGVCGRRYWVYDRKTETQDRKLFAKRYEDALRRPLGAYFRVNHKDLVAMHAAITEVGILYATSQVHDGWQRVGRDGIIEWTPDSTIIGGHAFAIVAYDERGFWLQNSWAGDWGYEGFAHISYDDWLANGSDIWVARLGAPVILRARESVSRTVGVAAQGSRSYVYCDLRPHIISLGNNGVLKTDGTYGTSEADVREIFGQIAARITDPGTGTPIQHLLLYAHGGLTAEDSAIQKVADLRPTLLDAGVYPISIIWHTDLWTTIRNILQDALTRRRPEGFLDNAKDFMLDRLDDALEPVARAAGGRTVWAQMQQNGVLASSRTGGLTVVLGELKRLAAKHPKVQMHLVGHSAGSIILGAFAGANQAAATPLRFETCTMWAPACTIDFYREQYLPAIRGGSIRRFAIFTLTDRAEQDDNCANIYHKSLLYLVSDAFEAELRRPWFRGGSGEPLLGMEKYIRQLGDRERPKDWVLSPNVVPDGRIGASRSTSHGGFDDDHATLTATLARILGENVAGAPFTHHASAASHRDRRQAIMQQTSILGR